MPGAGSTEQVLGKHWQVAELTDAKHGISCSRIRGKEEKHYDAAPGIPNAQCLATCRKRIDEFRLRSKLRDLECTIFKG